jgi:hypothetical protein
MVPDLDESGNLPPGVHDADWSELQSRFGTTPHRSGLLSGLREAALALKAAGCRRLYIDGSFISAKAVPEDFDACWEAFGVNAKLLDRILLTFDHGRLAQKIKYGGELFPASAVAETTAPWRTFLDFFQQDKCTGKPKGIIAIDLGRMT